MHAYVNILTRGDLSSLRWIESPVKYFTPKGTTKSLCQVYYAPLNFRDIMLATGKLPPDAIPGNKTHWKIFNDVKLEGEGDTDTYWMMSGSSHRRLSGSGLHTWIRICWKR